MKKLRSKIIYENLIDAPRKASTGNTLQLLKRVWDDLPADFTTGERSLFIEIAERLLKVDPGEVN